MNKINWKDVAARTAKTFVATFIGAFSFVDAIFLIKDKDEATRYIASSLISAVSAAVTAVWNVLLELFGDQINAAVDKVVTWVFNLVRKNQPEGEGADPLDEDQGDLDLLPFDEGAAAPEDEPEDELSDPEDADEID